MTENRWAWSVIGFLAAGACAGSLLGCLEASMIVLTGGQLAEYGLFPFGYWAYGVLGAALALPLACAYVLLLQGRRFSQRFWFAAGSAVVAFPTSLLVGRYHLVQRYFAEQMPAFFSGRGLLVFAGLVVGASLMSSIAAVFVWLVAGRGKRAAARLVAMWVVGWGALHGVAVVLRPKEPTPVREARASKPSPNVVLVVVDTLRADALGAHSGERATPHTDALARDGVRFRNAYAQSSWTRPSIATILTGEFPAVHGAVHKFDPLPEEADTLAERLRRAGYWTAAFVTNINVAPIFNFQQGFGEYHYLAPNFYFGASDSATRLSVYKLLRLLRERFLRRRLYFYHYYQDAQVVTEHVTKWLAEHPPQPFFLFIHYMDPHDPYFEIPYNGRGIARVMEPNPPPEQAPEMRRLYAADVSYFDEHFGALLDEFRRRGLYDNTVFVLTADHGEEFHEHGGWWHGTTLYEEQIRVPLIFRVPGDKYRGQERNDLVETLDLVPTILAQVGLPVPPGLPGRDLFSQKEPPEVLYAEESLEGNELEMIRWKQWKLIVANEGNPRGLPALSLFDLEKDPEEKNNLAAIRGDLVRELLQKLVETRRAIRSRRLGEPR